MANERRWHQERDNFYQNSELFGPRGGERNTSFGPVYGNNVSPGVQFAGALLFNGPERTTLAKQTLYLSMDEATRRITSRLSHIADPGLDETEVDRALEHNVRPEAATQDGDPEDGAVDQGYEPIDFPGEATKAAARAQVDAALGASAHPDASWLGAEHETAPHRSLVAAHVGMPPEANTVIDTGRHSETNIDPKQAREITAARADVTAAFNTTEQGESNA